MNARILLVAALLALPCASDALAQCTYATPTTGQIYTMPTSGLVTRIYGSRMQSSWVVTAVSGVVGEDWDVALYQNPSASSPCVVDPIASSSYGGNAVDFVIGDCVINPHTDVYARHNRYSGTGAGRAQWRDGAGALLVNGFDTNRTWGADSLVDVWGVTLTAGVTYTLNFSPSVGLGASLLVYRNPTGGTYWAPRSGALATLSATGTFTAPATGSYALVVANDGHAAGNYAISVGDCTPLPLTSGLIRSQGGKQATWELQQSFGYWAVIAVEHGSLEVYSSLSGAYPTCGSGLLESHSSGGSLPSYVVGNFNEIPVGTFYARTTPSSMGANMNVFWDGGPDQLTVDGPPVRRTVDNDTRNFAEVWDLYLVAGQSYRFYLDNQGLGLYLELFADPGTGNHWFDPSAAVYSWNGSFLYTATTTGYHGLVVRNSTAVSGRYTLGVSKAPCGIPERLEARVPTAVASPDAWFRFYPATGGWEVFAVRGGNASDDWDLSMSADPTGQSAPQCIGPPLATSGLVGGMVDLTVYNMARTSLGLPLCAYPPCVGDQHGGVAEFDTTHGVLNVNAPQLQAAMSATTLVHVYDAYMSAGLTYTIEFVPGAAGQSVLLFEDPGTQRYAAGRAGAVASGTSSVTYTALVSGIHGVVVVNDAGVASTYRLRFGRCMSALMLANNTGQQPSYAYSTFFMYPGQQRWGAVGVRSEMTDWDLAVSGLLGSTFPNCIGSSLATSTSSSLNFVDFVVGDFHHLTAANHYVSAYQYTAGAAGDAYVNWSQATEALVPNVINMAPTATGDRMSVHTFDTHLEAGITYTIGLTHTGSANLHLLLFRNPGSGAYWAGRSSAVLDLPVASGSVTYTPPVSDDYALVVVNDDGAADTFIPYVRYCPAVVPLTSGLPIVVFPSAFVSFSQETPYWAAIGVRSASDWDMEVDRLGSGGSPGYCFSDPLALSNAKNIVDFVVGDFNAGGNTWGTYFARPSAYHALSYPGAVEFERGLEVLTEVVQPVSRATGDSDVLGVWDAFMEAGRDYSIYFTHTGSANVKALLFRNPGGPYWAPRSARVLETAGHATFHAPTTAFYGLVVVNDNGLPGEYTIGIQAAGVAVEGDAPPNRTSLGVVSPNPARGPLTVQFALHQPAFIRLELLDLFGRRVATIEEGARAAGRWNVAWSSAQGALGALPPGLYCLRMQAGGRTVGEKKVVLIR